MITIEMSAEEDEAAVRAEALKIAQEAEKRRLLEVEARSKHVTDRGEFIRLSRRSAYLARSLSADHQRERAALQGPLMQLYATLNPTSIYKWDDDFDVVLRAQRRA